MLAALDPILFDLALLFGLCVAAVLVFWKLRVPPLVGFLLTGAVIGPNATGLVGHIELVEQLAEVGVVILLFSVGMELPLRQLARMRRTVLVGGGLQMGLTLLLGAGVAMLAGLPTQPAVFLGLLLALSSTAAATKLLTDRGELGSPVARYALGLLVAQDLAVVPIILLLPVLAGGTGDTGIWSVLGATGMAFVWLSVAVAIAAVLGPRVLDLVCRTRSREAFILALIGICLALAVATAQLGLSLALGAFLAGVVLAESDYHHMAVSEVEPFRDALSSLFFVSIGMLFDPAVLVQRPLLVAGALAAVVVGKAVVIVLTGVAMGKPGWLGLRTGLLLGQVGEFSFVLVQIADPSLLPGHLREVFLAVAVLSIAATPMLHALGHRLRRAAHDRSAGDGDGGHGHGHGERRDHAIVVGFGPAGQTLARAMQALSLPFVVIEMNASTVKAWRAEGVDIFVGDATRGIVLNAAGVRRARALVLAVNDGDAAIRIARTARQLAPRLRIVARATYLGEVEGLHRAGVHDVVPQELETAVEIMVRVLRLFLVADDEIGKQVRTVRESAPGVSRAAASPQRPPADIGNVVPGVAVEITRVEAGSVAAGKTLAELQMRRRTSVTVIAHRHGDQTDLNIDPERAVAAGDVLVLLGPEERLADAQDLLRAPAPADGEHGVPGDGSLVEA